MSDGASSPPSLWELHPPRCYGRGHLDCSCAVVALLRPAGWLRPKGFLIHPRRGRHDEFLPLVLLELWIVDYMASFISRAHK